MTSADGLHQMQMTLEAVDGLLGHPVFLSKTVVLEQHEADSRPNNLESKHETKFFECLQDKMIESLTEAGKTKAKRLFQTTAVCEMTLSRRSTKAVLMPAR